MERDPTHGVVAHEPRRHHQLREARGIHAVGGVTREIDALTTEKIDGVGSVGVTRHVEVTEVEFPDGAVSGEVGEVAGGVGEGEADLDEVESVNVGLEEAVVVGGTVAVVEGFGGEKKSTSEMIEFFQLNNIYLAHIHAISNLAADRADSRERSLKRRRMDLGIPPSTLKTTAFGRRILRIKLPSYASHCLFLCR